MKRENVRNIAIIAHVDHGKTTLVDKMLGQTGVFRTNEHVVDRVMDSNDLEREKGITILAKNTSIKYNDYNINIIDTPGHADFGGEVERIMKMADGVLLVVDAFEGCMPQTRFVLRKALEEKLIPVVVINKMDRPAARPAEVIDEVLDLFIDLGATEDQLDFPVVYASAIQGVTSLVEDERGENFNPLFQSIIDHIPAPSGDMDGPTQMQVTLLEYSDYIGRIGVGTIARGSIKNGQQITVMKRDGSKENMRINKLFGFQGLKKVEIEEAFMGDIVAVAGLGDINIGETVCATDCHEALPLLIIDEPTLQMGFMVNNSPFSGKEGEPITSRKLGARLKKEIETDVSLRVEETDNPELYLVSGRGELHLAILVETMRREGLEFQVSKPNVIMKEVDGKIHEPYEFAFIDVPEDYTGAVMEKLGTRKGELLNMINNNGQVRLEYSIPARGLVGFRTEFLTDTRGYGVINHTFNKYGPYKGEISGRRNGVLIAHETGKSTNYGLLAAEERGTLFIGPGTDVYEGMVVGENSKEQDLTVNVCKEKQATNVRSSTKDDTVKLKGHHPLVLEYALAYLDDDEFLEITPETLRLRKRYLKKNERDRFEKQKNNPRV